MAKFRFKLQNFLGVKEKVEEQKKLEYGRAVAALERERQKKMRLVNEKSANIASFKQKVETKISPPEIDRLNKYIDYLKRKIIEQDDAIAKAAAFAEEKRAALVAAMHERKILEKLKEKHLEQFLVEEKIAEQKIVDEVVSYRFNNQ